MLLTVLLAIAIFSMPTFAKPPATQDANEMQAQVMNGYTNPVPVEVLNQSTCGKIPVQYYGQAFSPNSASEEEVIFTMPIGREIDYVVIEQVTLHSFADFKNNVTNVYIESTLGGNTVKHYLTYQELCHGCVVSNIIPIDNQLKKI